MKSLIKFTGWFVGVLLVAGWVAPTLVVALQAGGIGVMPAPNENYPDRTGWFVYEEVEPGTVIEDVARVINPDSAPNTIVVDAVDAFMTQDGGFALLDNPEDNTDIGSWIELSKTEVTLPANKELLVPFTITIPKDAEVGDHIGGIAVYRSENTSNQTLKRGGAAVSISTRVGARVYLTIKGDITRKLALKSRAMYGRAEHLAFRFKIENLGNVRADIKMSAKIYGLGGVYDSQDKISLGQIFPKKISTIEALWPGKDRPLFGPYLAKITLEDTFEGLNPASSTLPPSQPIYTWAFTFFVPWTQVAILVFFLFVVWFIWHLWQWRKLIGLSRTPVVAYKVKKGDHIVDIAHDYHVGWKLLAKLNDIKSPYSLRGVAQLYVPDVRGTRRSVPVPQFWGPLVAPLISTAKGISRWRRKPDYIIVIEKGDKPKDVEAFTGLSWARVLAYNNLPATTRPRAGMELKVPEQ